MWVGTAATRNHTAATLDALPSDMSEADRLMVAAEAHLRQMLAMSDYSKAAIRNAGEVAQSIRKRQIREEDLYGELWPHLLNDLNRSGNLRPELDPYIAQMLMLGALNWALEWWDPTDLRSTHSWQTPSRSSAIHFLTNRRHPHGGVGTKCRRERGTSPAQ